MPDSEDLGTMGVLEVREDWPNELWEAIQNAKEWRLTIKSAPLETVFEHPIMVEQNPDSLYGDAGSEKSKESKAPSLKTLPSFLGESEHNSIIRKLPIQQKLGTDELDMTNLRTLMSTQSIAHNFSIIAKVTTHTVE